MAPQKCFFLLCLLSGTSAICQRPTWRENGFSIECKNASSKEWKYDAVKLIYNGYQQSRLMEELTIENSDSSIVEELYNPLYGSDVYFMKVSSSHIKNVSQDFFVHFPNLIVLDLSFNEIEDSMFISSLPQSVKDLHLKHNKISHIDFASFKHNLFSLDLSFNTIKEVDLKFKYFELPVTGYLNLNNNCIKTFAMDLTNPYQYASEVVISVANNPIQDVINYCDQSMRTILRVKLELSHSLINFPIQNISGCVNIYRALLLGNNSLNLNTNITFPKLILTHLDFSNSSIKHIPRAIFANKDMTSLNLSYNDLQLIDYPVFPETTVGETLDLSYCNIKNVQKLIEGLRAFRLILKGNQITELNSSSFNKLDVTNLDLSFNNITLKNDSFINCISVLTLTLSNSNISLIAEGAFNGLNALEELHLENNILKSLFVGVFKPTISLRYLYLQNNQLTILPGKIFSSLQLNVVTLSDNNIELIEHQAFFNLSSIKSIKIEKNRAPLNIEEGAISQLPLLQEVILCDSGLTTIDSNIFSGTPRLVTLDISGNNITFVNFSKPCQFHDLDLNVNGDVKTQSFFGLKHLKNLNFWNSTIKILENGAFLGLYNLESLKFKNSEIRVFEDGALHGLFGLKNLYLENALKTKTHLNAFIFQDLISLTNLNLSYQGLKTIAPNAFIGLKNLRNLSINNNALTCFEDLTFSGLEILENLDVSFNKLIFLKRDSFKGVGSLLSLNLSNNGLSDFELGVFQHTPKLENLILRDNNLTELKIGMLSNLYNLTSLDLSRNNISNLLFESFLSLKSLYRLNLEFNNIKTFGRYTLISKLKNFRKIKISKNKWQCDYLTIMLVTLNENDIDYSSKNINFYGDNVEGIDCIDLCKYLLCLKDSHGIN